MTVMTPSSLETAALHRPARVDVFLVRLGRFVRPNLVRRLAFLDQGLLLVGQVLARCGDHRRIDNLPPCAR